MKITMDQIMKLRQDTGAGVMDVKRALEEVYADPGMKAKSDGDITAKVTKIILEKGMARAEKKSERETNNGTVMAYIHHDGRSGALVQLLCETDFVAKTDDFRNLAKELAIQVTSMSPETVDELLNQVYVRDQKLTIGELVKQVAGKVGENIRVGEIRRMGM